MDPFFTIFDILRCKKVPSPDTYFYDQDFIFHFLTRDKLTASKTGAAILNRVMVQSSMKKAAAVRTNDTPSALTRPAKLDQEVTQNISKLKQNHLLTPWRLLSREFDINTFIANINYLSQSSYAILFGCFICTGKKMPQDFCQKKSDK